MKGSENRSCANYWQKGFVDNRAEGNAPLTVEALVDQLRT